MRCGSLSCRAAWFGRRGEPPVLFIGRWQFGLLGTSQETDRVASLKNWRRPRVAPAFAQLSEMLLRRYLSPCVPIRQGRIVSMTPQNVVAATKRAKISAKRVGRNGRNLLSQRARRALRNSGLSTLPLRRPLGRYLTGHVIVAPGRRGKNDEGKRFLTKEIKDWESSKAPT